MLPDLPVQRTTTFPRRRSGLAACASRKMRANFTSWSFVVVIFLGFTRKARLASGLLREASNRVDSAKVVHRVHDLLAKTKLNSSSVSNVYEENAEKDRGF